MKDFSNEIWGYSLKNAIEFGKTDAGKVLPKLFQHGLEKDKIREVMPRINEIIKRIQKNSIEISKQDCNRIRRTESNFHGHPVKCRQVCKCA